MDCKKIINFISDNKRIVIEILMFIIALILVYSVDLPESFGERWLNPKDLPDSIFYIIITAFPAIPVLKIMLLGFILYKIRSCNKEYILNMDNYYHDYSYFWYRFCSSIMGISKCNLILVPIHMQFSLVIHQVFHEFPLQDESFPESDADEKVIVKDFNNLHGGLEYNIIIEDTYLISMEQLPLDKKELPSFKISRNNKGKSDRHFNRQFINEIVRVLRDLPDKVTVNIYTTTNPKHTFYIAQDALKLSDRGNIEHVFVYQQERDNGRHFKKFYKVY
ncbi:hypothetical protein DWZ54_04945 [Mitsuokella sp. AF33-22]|uniref:hypothetical protein n=1 Tax=Mitsuokella sp. AF33-22 TaxID=2292047 RepID=UPI000E4C9CDA|nr:hypothetical protein [Mitsuokella sp. AF33-22]RHM55825.1 hypothetical protein DWZ54_04945 [Mitsuokella sp. AF33-22]